MTQTETIISVPHGLVVVANHPFVLEAINRLYGSSADKVCCGGLTYPLGDVMDDSAKNDPELLIRRLVSSRIAAARQSNWQATVIVSFVVLPAWSGELLWAGDFLSEASDILRRISGKKGILYIGSCRIPRNENPEVPKVWSKEIRYRTFDNEAIGVFIDPNRYDEDRTKYGSGFNPFSTRIQDLIVMDDSLRKWYLSVICPNLA